MPSVANISFLVLSCLCALINIAPTLSHLKQGHSGPASFGIWTVLLNANNFTNGVVWSHDAVDRAPIFCDISAKLGVVGPLGLLISNFCIIRYLASIVTPSASTKSRETAKRMMFFDYLMSFGIPVLIALASLIFQVARYQVSRLGGCSNVMVLTWPTIFILIMWSPIVCGLSSGYSLYVLYWLIRQHTGLRRLVAKSGTPLTLGRFVRMSALGAAYLFVSTPYTIVATIAKIREVGPYIPWESWRTIHDESNNLSIVRQNPVFILHVRDWSTITAGLVVFLFFSSGDESLAMYAKLFRYFRMDGLISCFGVGPRLWRVPRTRPKDTLQQKSPSTLQQDVQGLPGANASFSSVNWEFGNDIHVTTIRGKTTTLS